MCWPRVGEANPLFSVCIALWRPTALAKIYNAVGRQRNLELPILDLIIPPRGYTVLPLSVRPSKIFFVTFFSATIDGRNLIFGHNLHYRYAISWEAILEPSDSYFLFADLVGFYPHWTYMHIFLNNYWWEKSGIWSQASYRYPISWEVAGVS